MKNLTDKRKYIIFLSCMIAFLLLPAFCLYNMRDKYQRINFKLSSTNLGESVCIYYNNGSMSFDEEHMVHSVINSAEQEYSFHIPKSDFIRIDFRESAGTTQIKEMTIATLFMERAISPQYLSSCIFSVDVGEVDVRDEILVIESVGVDPCFIISDINKISGKPKLYNISIGIIYLVVTIFASAMISMHYEKIENLLSNMNKKWAVIISCVLFFSYRILFLILHEGYFAFDEFYHISTLNPDYITAYDRAPYINYMVEIICKILGQSDLIVKLVPFFLGTVSFLCGLYLLYNIYDNPYWIVTVSAILTWMPHIQYNHFYIRMYVFLEALVMLDCVLIYRAEQKKGTIWEKVNILLVLYKINN